MAERDPFGRLPDENPLAGLGSLSDGIESQAPAQPVVSVRPADDARGRERDEASTSEARDREREPRDTAAPAAGSREATLRDLLVSMQRMRSGASPPVVGNVGRIVKAVFVIAIIVAIGNGLGGLMSVGETVKDGFSDLPSKVGVPPGGPGAEPLQLGERSLLLRRNLAPALRRMRTSGLGRLKSLSIRPARIDAQLLTKDGRLRSVQQRFDGGLRELSLSGGGIAALRTIPFARVNPAAPWRLARSAAGRTRRPVSQVDYVALVDTGPSSVWTVVMKGGEQFLGDARGRITRRIE